MASGLAIFLLGALLHYMAHLLALKTLLVLMPVFVHKDGHFEWPVESWWDGSDV